MGKRRYKSRRKKKKKEEEQPNLSVGTPADPYEKEADKVADNVMKVAQNGEGPIQRKSGGSDEIPMNSLSATPGTMIQKQGNGGKKDSPLVKQSRARLKVMEDCYGKYMLANVRKTSRDMSSKQLREKRKLMDKDGADPLGEFREPEELKQIKKLNKVPLNIRVTATKITFNVNLHVRFEGRSIENSKGDFDKLKKSFNDGLKLIWNHQIRLLMPLEGREFEVVPTFVHIDDSTKRDLKYWLISVRPTDKAKLKYNDTVVGGDEDGVDGLPTSATDPMLDGGVMSLPPSHITKPDILGHELLHLFGLLDRYMVITDISADKKKKTTRLEPTRAHLHKRPDPLGSQDGTILKEDLNFLFDEYGIYDQETKREKMEAAKSCAGMGEAQVRVEIERLKEIIKTGKDSRSLIKLRTDFRDKILDSADDI